MDLHVGRRETRRGILPVVLQGREGLDVRAFRVVLAAEHRLQKRVEALDQGPVGPVGGGQLESHAVLIDGLPFCAEDGDVGAAKAVDRLLGVAHEEELPLATAQEVEDVALAGIGVLELVHEQGADLLLPVSAHRNVFLEELECLAFQVVEVEGAAPVLRPGVVFQCPVVELEQRRDDLPGQTAVQLQISVALEHRAQGLPVPFLELGDDHFRFVRGPVRLPPLLLQDVPQWPQMARDIRPVTRLACRFDRVPVVECLSQVRRQRIRGSLRPIERAVCAQREKLAEAVLDGGISHEGAERGGQVRLPHGP